MPTKPTTPDDLLMFEILGLGENDSGQGALEGDSLPSARSLRRLAKRRTLRMAQQTALSDVLANPPTAGESVHIVSDAKFDFWTWVPVMLDWLGRSDSLYCSTWTLSRGNAVDLFELWDAQRFPAAHMLTGTYFKRRETAVYSFLLDGILARGGRYRAFQNHAKVLLLANADKGAWLTVEGSANLTANPRLEQYVLTNDRPLYEFHRGWMEEMFTTKALAVERDGSSPPPNRVGFHHKRAGVGVMACSNNPSERRRLIGWKLSPVVEQSAAARYAAALVELIKEWSPTLPPASVVTVPPQGASWPATYAARLIGEAVANLLGLPFQEVVCRTDTKRSHHPMRSLAQAPFTAEVETGSTYIVIDDMITSGATMRNTLAAIRNAGGVAFGFAYHGS